MYKVKDQIFSNDITASIYAKGVNHAMIGYSTNDAMILSDMSVSGAKINGSISITDDCSINFTGEMYVVNAEDCEVGIQDMTYIFCDNSERLTKETEINLDDKQLAAVQELILVDLHGSPASEFCQTCAEENLDYHESGDNDAWRD